VCNGEIYNHRALRQDLEGRKAFGSESDVEVIAHLYEDHGAGCVNLLDGMYAFVLYDSRRRTFLAARDRFGIKPLYYIRDADRWLFASEIKAFLGTGANVEDIQLLPPGHYLTEAGPRRYYDLADYRRRSADDPGLLYQILDAAVRRHLMADPSVGIGTFLSGGIDSSVVTAIAARYLPGLTAFTVGVPDSVDVADAAALCRHLGIAHVVVPFDLDQIWPLIPEAVYQMENYNPFIVLEGLMQMMLAKAARERGIKVMLSGEGADEIFAGYRIYRGKPPEATREMLLTSMAQINNTECLRLDRASMAHSVEARVPFLDPMVVEYAVNLPVAAMLRQEGGQLTEKWILRMAAERILPPEFAWRPKLGFYVGSGIADILDRLNDRISDEVDFPPWSGGVRSERHAAERTVIPSMLARASAGVR
jgi:asparagine synthase (glutamine-hydrolysing)